VIIARSIFRARLALFVALALAVPGGIRAEEKPQPPEMSEKTRELFGKVTPLVNGAEPTTADLDSALRLLEAARAATAPESYDMALILDTTAKIYLRKEQIAKAIEPQETAQRIADAHPGWFDDNMTVTNLNLLARLIYAEAVTIKDLPAQRQQVTRAAGYLKRYLAMAKKPTLDDQMFYAQLLYAQATSDPSHLNVEMLHETEKVIQDAMHASIYPKEVLYQLMIACVQQENDDAKAADLLELAVKKFPAKKDYWPALTGLYVQRANLEKDERKQREFYIRAINTVERAQALGLMNDPKWNYNLVTFYIAAGQFSKATDLLHAGLKKGTIESTITNWRILGSYYQQANKDYEAIEALKEAAKLFPTQGMLELQIGDIYRGLEKIKEARDYYRIALQKGNLEKPYVAYQLLAYAAIELDDVAEAKQAVDEASKFPEAQKDQQLQSLKKYIDSTFQEREDAKREKEAKEAARKK
jgi:Tfp pilus assembly protein PilF